MHNRTAKMTSTRQVYSCAWTRIWTRSWISSWTWVCNLGLALLLFKPQYSYSKCPVKSGHSILEIGTNKVSKDLICEVADQCKVSWMKEGVPLDLTDKDARVSCEDICNCRALNFQSLEFEDAGNYTCLAVEGCEGEDLPQSTRLRVDPKDKQQAPVIIQNSKCEDAVAHPREDVTFCCICQVGMVIQDTYTNWVKDWEFSLDEHRDIAAENATSHDPKAEKVSCITLYNVNKTYTGNYTMVCTTEFGPEEITIHLKVEVRWWLYVISVMVVLVGMTIIAGIIYRTNRTKIKLLCKDSFGTQERDDGKLYDAYISYYWSDSESSNNLDRRYALDLRDRLTKIGYTVCLAETDFPPGNETSQEIVQSLMRSRRYIILLSPQFLTYRYMSFETEQCLDMDNIKKYKQQIIPIFIRDISPDVIKDHVALDHIISTHPRLDWKIFEDSSRSREEPIRTLSMENGNPIELEASVTVRKAPKLKRAEERVWKTLRLQMPPVPRGGSGVGTEEPLMSVETDSLIHNEVSQEDLVNGVTREEGAQRMQNLVL